MERETRKKLEGLFRNYRKNKRRLDEIGGDIGLSAIDYSRLNVQTTPGNTLEEKICRYLDESDRLTLYTRVVWYTLIKYSGQVKEELIKTYYFDGQSIMGSAHAVHISRRTLFRYLDDILESAETYAKELKVL